MQEITRAELQEIEAITGHPVEKAASSAYDAAVRFDKQIAGWMPPLQSADAEILPDKGLLDARSRETGRNDSYVNGVGTIHKDSIVGAFYMLNARPNLRVLGRSEEWAAEFQNEVEEKFTIWAESPQKWVDAARTNDFTAMIRLAVGISVYTGEVLATVEFPKQAGREYRTAIQMVDTDRLGTPDTMVYQPNIRGGIKSDAYGAPLSAFIRVRHPSDYFRGWESGANWWKEVPFQKPWGRQQVIYLREQQRVDQTRAISELTAALREIAIMRKWRDVTLQKAVLAATYAATITSELPAEAIYQQLGAVQSGQPDMASGSINYATEFLKALNTYSGAAKNLLVDGSKIPHLFPGTKLEFQKVGDPNGVGQPFEQSLLRYVAAAAGVSYEELSKDFSRTNYSSARAALSQTAKFMAARKRVIADSFASSIYRLWLEEAINNDRLDTVPASEAAEFYSNGHLNLMFDALSAADWIGASRGQIDELKETQAAVLRIKYGLSTHEDELARLGKDWRKVYAQLERESKEREARNIVLLEDNSVNAASGTPREDESDGTEEADDDEPND